MADAITETDEQLDEQAEEETDTVETREDKVKRLKQEMADLKSEGLTDAEIKEIAGDISAAGDSTTGTKEAKDAAEQIAEEVEEEYDIVLSDSEVDRLAKRIVELQTAGDSGSGTATTKGKTPRASRPDTSPRSTHFTERRLWGGNA